MKYLFTALITFFLMDNPTHKLDFAAQSAHNNWYIVNDGVMGGRSAGFVSYQEESMVFKGKTSLENNGGFSSVRSPYKNWRLGEYKGIRIRVKSQYARNYDFSLETRGPWYSPKYKHPFSTPKNQWKTIEMPLADFQETRVGQPTGRALPHEVVPAIQRLTIILFDKKAGDFNLEVDYIELY